ncbi:hypothetical protein JX265_009935 [Neoarthrinium moseri]|uniref:Uncharacterized protein n=1 Tax=Neoarthrinium moseri TaxID=1658444 RepID=A0A9P9WFG1_9PEZI|nr:uncharacterized protein JN550_008576 [Neoarthrinium moseri]KAI1860536.1 hypothetical protein JX265_009935 [Neoarthrinium moseri]KAI1865030.1 hypothetical protein JN550_008576 [Neoarthrinium moseri]
MRLFTKIFLFFVALFLARLNSFTRSPTLTPAEAHVLKTVTYGLGGGLLINTLCGIAAPSIDPQVAAADGFMSCAPFGLAGTVITARVYVFTTGGWGMEQWWYANQLPRVVENAVREKLGWEQRPLSVPAPVTRKPKVQEGESVPKEEL